MKKIILSAVLLSLFVSCDKTPSKPSGSDDDPNPPVSEDVFYKGTTMCFASYIQNAGLVYRENGVPTDPYKSVKNHGGNIVRLQLDRVPFPVFGGCSIDWQTRAAVIEDARKAKAQGLDILLTLKPDYDIFTDAAAYHNICPEDWNSKSEDELGKALYDWVYESLDALAAEDIYPAIVAVGNEVNIGFLKPSSSAAADNSRTGRLLVQGHKAVRDFASAKGKKMLSLVHIANPAKVEATIRLIEAAGAKDYDVIGMSWYPGPGIEHSMNYASFSAFIPVLKKNFSKTAMVIETSYTFTTGTVGGKWMGDWCDNSYNYPMWNESLNATNYTPAKQKEWLLALAQDVKKGGGIGLVTWGTESLPDLLTGKEEGHGLGIYTYPAKWAYGSTWENNSYWDFTNNNNLHQGIDWMKEVK